MQSHFRVDREGKVDRRCPLRELDDVSRRREDEDLVLIQVELEELEKLIGRLRVHLELEHLTEPCEMPVEIVATRLVFLVPPVRRDAVVGRLVHLARAYLDLEQ